MASIRSKHEILQIIVIGCLAVFPQFVYSSYNMALGKDTLQSSIESGWVSDKAVDGIIGADVESDGGGSCSSTIPSRFREAWWIVDLEHISRIKTINITYRKLYPFRLSGFYLYASNTSRMDNIQNTGYLCYHDDTRNPDLPSVNQSRSCPVNGRYITFYNKRPADNGPKSHQYYSTAYAVVELCEVQVFGCPVNQFGPACNKICHCGVGGCDPDSGLCDVNGCQSGWKGTACSEKCEIGEFGVDCSHTCHCSTPGCDRFIGSCTVPGCEAGWQGNVCDQECRLGTFGVDCFHTCHCSTPGCDKATGSCTVPGCTAGWQGDTCDQECKLGTYGVDCNHTCHCSTPGCDKATGSCTVPGCTAGWQGDTCDQDCRFGTFGVDCIHTCHCSTPGCHKATGSCTVPGCTAGWQGNACDQECKLGTYGVDCSHTCHCSKPGCDRATGSCTVPGCEAGWQGNACDQGKMS